MQARLELHPIFKRLQYKAEDLSKGHWAVSIPVEMLVRSQPLLLPWTAAFLGMLQGPVEIL